MAEPNELLVIVVPGTDRVPAPAWPAHVPRRARSSRVRVDLGKDRQRKRTGRPLHRQTRTRGVRWPNSAYREGLREVLQVASDVELGFANTWLDWLEDHRVRQHGSGDSARVEGVFGPTTELKHRRGPH